MLIAVFFILLRCASQTMVPGAGLCGGGAQAAGLASGSTVGLLLDGAMGNACMHARRPWIAVQAHWRHRGTGMRQLGRQG